MYNIFDHQLKVKKRSKGINHQHNSIQHAYRWWKIQKAIIDKTKYIRAIIMGKTDFWFFEKYETESQ